MVFHEHCIDDGDVVLYDTHTVGIEGVDVGWYAFGGMVRLG